MQRIVKYLEKINYQVGIRENGKEKSTVGWEFLLWTELRPSPPFYMLKPNPYCHCIEEWAFKEFMKVKLGHKVRLYSNMTDVL